MKEISVASDIVPLGKFKAELSKWLRSVQENGQPVIVTQNGRPAGVLVAPQDFDDLRQTKLFIASIRRGMEDANAGRVYDSVQLKQELEKRRKPYSARTSALIDASLATNTKLLPVHRCRLSPATATATAPAYSKAIPTGQ